MASYASTFLGLAQRFAELGGPIETPESLALHLQFALEVEHATIPPYLYALYSLKPGQNAKAAAIIHGVVLEEMLHMVTVANLLVACGGRPSFTHEGFVPHYPMPLPHSAGVFEVPLERFSHRAIETFCRIEHPAPRMAPPEDNHFHTLGQFYLAIEEGIERLGPVIQWDKRYQLGPEVFYNGSATLNIEHGDRHKRRRLPLIVDSTEDAILALRGIVQQGEGVADSILEAESQAWKHDFADEEYAHYFRFRELLFEREYRPTDSPGGVPAGPTIPVDWDAVWPVAPNLAVDRLPAGSEVQALAAEFRDAYRRMLGHLEAAFAGEPGRMMRAVILMSELRDRATSLMRVPLGDGFHAGPCFR